MRRKSCLFLVGFLVIGLVLGGVASVYAEGSKVNLTLGIDKASGDTTYQIGGTLDVPGLGTQELHFPISELEFPLDVYMVSVGGSIEFREKWKVSAGVKKNITSDAGKMKDSDWGYYWLAGYPWGEQDTLDIYSESDAQLDALMMDINLCYRFYQRSNWSFAAGLGYILQSFDYEVSNLDQWYPSSTYYFGYDFAHDYVSGKVITYEARYSIPYMEIAAELKTRNKFHIEATLGYSPMVNVTDEDNHILRDKVSKGDCDGDATLFSLKGHYEFWKPWFLTIQVGYMSIDTDGKQTQYIEGELLGTIDQKIKSQQMFIGFAVVYPILKLPG